MQQFLRFIACRLDAAQQEAATAVVELLMTVTRILKTCCDACKRQAINLRNCCTWLVGSFECMMMHGLANPKFKYSLYRVFQKELYNFESL
jgi:hypothetical protein